MWHRKQAKSALALFAVSLLSASLTGHGSEPTSSVDKNTDSVMPLQRASEDTATALGGGLGATAAKAPGLEDGFLHPPLSARPWVFWFWMNGNITREGITADLEAMARVGIGGTLIMSVTNNIPPGRVRFMSPQWRELFMHAIKEADRLGLSVIMNNGDSWCGGGGPWNTVDNSMQTLTWSETQVEGPVKFSSVLRRPPAKLDHYRDIAVLALPELPPGRADDFYSLKPKVTTSSPDLDGKKVLDRDRATEISVPVTQSQDPRWLQVELDEPFRARALTVYTGRGRNGHGGVLEASDDGKTFRRVAQFNMAICSASTTSTGQPLGLALEPVTARFFRIVFTKPDRGAKEATISEIILHADLRISQWEGKAGFVRQNRPETQVIGDSRDVSPGPIVNLTDKMDGNGLLRWDFPAGRWTILRLVFHRYAMQPWLDRFPGMTFGWNGIHYERTVTWWEQSRAWNEYLARCQFLLQQGLFVADVLLFNGENAPCDAALPSGLPDSFDYDVCSAEVLLESLSVKDGRLVLPSGMSYRILVLPDERAMRPEVLGKVHELVCAGASVIGPKPETSPSLSGYPDCDVKVKALAAQLWGDVSSPGEKATGKGKVYWGKSLLEVLEALQVQPDFTWESSRPEARIAWIHRRISDAEVYFVSNQRDAFQTIDATFRVRDRVPELWFPDTGRQERAGLWRPESDGRVTIPLRLDPKGSVFVVFRTPATNIDPAAELTQDNTNAGQKPTIPTIEETPNPAAEVRSSGKDTMVLAWQSGQYTVTFASGRKTKCEVAAVPAPREIGGPWEVGFQPGRGAPSSVVFDQLMDWTKHPGQGVRYFSGSATYRKEFDLPADLLEANRMMFLDLGKVKVIAEVRLNGRNLAILWKPPFRMDVSSVLKPSGNIMEVRVTNLWPNRLIGDEQYPPYLKWDSRGAPDEWPGWVIDGGPVPETGRSTFTTWHHWKKDDPLLESGLLGPVTLRVAVVVPLGAAWRVDRTRPEQENHGAAGLLTPVRPGGTARKR